MGALLEVEGLVVCFGGVRALDGFDLHVGEGEVVALVGPNGAGKTTVLNCLNGVVRPAAGRARLGGCDLLGLRPREVAALGVARTFQHLGLVPSLDVASNILLGRHLLTRSGMVSDALRRRRSRRRDQAHLQACAPVVEALGLGPHLGTRVGDLPAGTRKAVELARALASEPRLLLADEPVAGLGREEAARAAAVISRWRTERGMGVLLVDHDVETVMGVADRVVVVDAGRAVLTGPAVEAALEAGLHVVAHVVAPAPAPSPAHSPAHSPAPGL